MQHRQLQIIDEEGMLVLGAKLAALACEGLIIYLEGDLGAGKTTLVRGFLRAFDYRGAVKSPTFTIVEPYSLDYSKLLNYNGLDDGVKLNSQYDIHVDSRIDNNIDKSLIHAELKVYHFDLYRLEDPEELEYMGIRDYLDGRAIALIEWPEKGSGVLPEADLIIKIIYQQQKRQLEFVPKSEKGMDLLSRL